MDATVGIVIPAYRPSPDRLATFIAGIRREIDPDRIHVELDVPTPDVIRTIERTDATLRVADHRRGKGAAITAGFERLGTGVLAFADADGSTSPAALATVLDPVCAGEADLAVGSRRHPDAVVTAHQSRLRRRLGDAFPRVARRLLPVDLYDYQCGAKAIDAGLWRSIRSTLVSPGFAWDIEFLVAAASAGATIREVPISWEDRPGSTVDTAGTVLAFGRSFIRIRARAHTAPVASLVDALLPSTPPLVSRPSILGRPPPDRGIE